MLDAIRNRRSVRRYNDRPVPEEIIDEVLKAAMFAPTAKNNRPCEFVVVTRPETKLELSRATPYSAFAKDAPIIIVICYDNSRGSRFKEDCAIAAENIYIEATHQGLGACYIQIAEGAKADAGEPEPFVKGLLHIPDHVSILCLMTLGYPVRMPEPHDASEFDTRRIHRERF